MNTHETDVSLETAKLLKKAGFDWEIDSLYRVYPEKPVKFEVDSKLQFNWNIHSNIISAPTLTVAQKWLREIYHTLVDVVMLVDKIVYGYRLTGFTDKSMQEIDYQLGYDTYEEALEAGIKKTLEIILEKGE